MHTIINNNISIIYLTKMCIKSASYLHDKSANRALDMVLFLCFGANVAH